MLRQANQRAFFYFILAIGALIALASGISNILSVPEPFFQGAPPPEPPLVAVGNLGFVRSELIFYVFFAFFILAIISLVLIPEGRKRIARFILLFAALYLLSQFLIPRIPAEKMQAVATQPTGDVGRLDIQPVVTPQPDLSSSLELPDWLVTGIGISLALVIAGGIAAILWLIAHQKSTTSISGEISQEAQAALDALEAGADFEDVVLRCYARMSQVLAELRGLSRESAMTPHEFERVLIRLGFPSEPIRTLTHLFEEVRYGSIQQDEKDVQMAISSLNAIISYCKSPEPA